MLKLRHEYALRHKRPRTVVYVLGSATVREVIQTMAHHNIHRVYICNSHKQKEPIGIVTITGQRRGERENREGAKREGARRGQSRGSKTPARSEPQPQPEEWSDL